MGVMGSFTYFGKSMKDKGNALGELMAIEEVGKEYPILIIDASSLFFHVAKAAGWDAALYAQVSVLVEKLQNTLTILRSAFQHIFLVADGAMPFGKERPHDDLRCIVEFMQRGAADLLRAG